MVRQAVARRMQVCDASRLCVVAVLFRVDEESVVSLSAFIHDERPTEQPQKTAWDVFPSGAGDCAFEVDVVNVRAQIRNVEGWSVDAREASGLDYV